MLERLRAEQERILNTLPTLNPTDTNYMWLIDSLSKISALARRYEPVKPMVIGKVERIADAAIVAAEDVPAREPEQEAEAPEWTKVEDAAEETEEAFDPEMSYEDCKALLSELKLKRGLDITPLVNEFTALAGVERFSAIGDKKLYGKLAAKARAEAGVD